MLSWCRFSCCLLHWNGSHRVGTFLFHSFYDMSIVNSLTHSHKLSQSLNGKADLFRPPKHVLRIKPKGSRIARKAKGSQFLLDHSCSSVLDVDCKGVFVFSCVFRVCSAHCTP